ncbi:SET domain-containing histone-lysine N-methyltransferase [Hyalangium versicolor]|uniref:SET domain-containing histone-lysine N-methyltransferase n=1 Tax=Hyalangium versicolor TaxID=2861190 RepID=UPI001CCB9947|nr:SET domain-containing histone-lysine N-methyltransferase [Hyalangium versicolor]
MSTQPAADAAVTHLIRWLEQGGAVISPKMHVVDSGNGHRGVFASEDIAQDEVLLRIPRRRLVTVADARSSDLGRIIEAHTGFQDPNLYMTAFLLGEKERGEASAWKPFLDIQPQSFPTHPFYFQERELSLLKGSLVVELIAAQRRALEEDYSHLCRKVPGFERFTFAQFLWAHVAVLTRIFGGKVKETKVHCLAPFVDMLNDGIPANAGWGWSEDGEFFEVTADSAIPRGKELRDSYGAHSNAHLLRHYGFVHEHNPNNEVMVPLEISQTDPLVGEKRALLGLTDLSARHFFSLPFKPDAARIIELFSELRILQAGPEELALLKEAPDARIRAKVPLSPSNEAQVLLTLSSACAARLALYETSVEEDTRLLQDPNLPWNDRNCILLRRGEKQCLAVFAQAGS